MSDNQEKFPDKKVSDKGILILGLILAFQFVAVTVSIFLTIRDCGIF